MQRLLSMPMAFRWVLTLSVVLAVVVLSVTPGSEKSGDSIFSWLVANTASPIQKVAHVLIYAGLAFLWAWTLESVDSRYWRLLLALALSVGLGAVLEWHQLQVPGRFGSMADVLLNAGGAIVGIIAAILLL